jgi:hypothetical protein
VARKRSAPDRTLRHVTVEAPAPARRGFIISSS